MAANKNRAWREVAAIDAALEDGRIDEPGWFAAMQALVTPAYVAGANPPAQSGHSGDENSWRAARSLLCEALDRDGLFLDVGCASGHLMETVREWAAQRGVAIEPFGLDIAPELVALAQSRLPHWADRIWQGNGLDWQPPRRFTYVRAGLEYVPARQQLDFVAHLMQDATEHRLIIGPLTEDRDGSETEVTLTRLCFPPTGTAERAHDDPRLVRRVVWVDRRAA